MSREIEQTRFVLLEYLPIDFHRKLSNKFETLNMHMILMRKLVA